MFFGHLVRSEHADMIFVALMLVPLANVFLLCKCLRLLLHKRVIYGRVFMNSSWHIRSIPSVV